MNELVDEIKCFRESDCGDNGKPDYQQDDPQTRFS